MYPWGDGFVFENVVYYRVPGTTNCDGTCDVGSRPGGVSWVGAYDLSGNVMEWMENDYYQGFKVLRGGPWNGSANFVRSAYRYRNYPTYTNYGVGIRCSRSY